MQTQEQCREPDYMDYGPEYQAHSLECLAKDLCELDGRELDVVRQYLVRVRDMINRKVSMY